MFAIPKALLESLDLETNDSIDISVVDGKLIIDPHPGPRYSLAELLAACDTNVPSTMEDAAWIGDDRVGREAI